MAGRTKACQLKPNSASVLGLVPPTVAEPGVKGNALAVQCMHAHSITAQS